LYFRGGSVVCGGLIHGQLVREGGQEGRSDLDEPQFQPALPKRRGPGGVLDLGIPPQWDGGWHDWRQCCVGHHRKPHPASEIQVSRAKALCLTAPPRRRLSFAVAHGFRHSSEDSIQGAEMGFPMTILVRQRRSASRL
jgi:hypothetical protein